MNARRRPSPRGSAVLAALVAVGLALTSCTSPPAAHLSAPPVQAAPEPVDPAVEDLVAGAGMTTAAREIFLRARPEIQDSSTLATSCARSDGATGPGSTHTYGCVVRNRVFVRAFEQPEVRDLVYVVAAHELLHLVYAGLTAAQRARLDADLQVARDTIAALEDRLAVYAETDDDSLNEVHSILGTEFPDLPLALEAHYAAYFDRAAVLSAFRRAIGDREDELRRLEASIAATRERLTELGARLDQLRTGSVAAYNAAVATYNEVVAEHNGAIERYNLLLEEYRRLTA